ncbi:Transketolase 1 [Salinivirga cyanobacteriivorans]|uniref:Transketolase 1 n=1 Tax=Salinivirga cyanobacteriivorans TaxID=1307839 RepID=A0A0S2I3D6_9BACT|nr:transketolase [Salinivirga cyanobacteriivorans]ALO16740.1 Transketolase 1 [Salinivirga cyanobacteriivorans]
MDISTLKDTATQVRRDIIRMVHGASSGHPGGSLGCADFMTALYFKILKQNPKEFNMNGTDEDLFFLSNGHISPVWYSVLARAGYFDTKELSTFRKIDTRLQGHPTPEEGLPGVRVASGSLGQGLSVACGAALTKKLNKEKNLVYTLHGDGELQEGQIWEAAMFAAAREIDNIIATVDYNGKQIDGPVDNIIPLGDLRAKWESFGWIVFEMDGNKMEEVLETIEQAQKATGNKKPVVILMRTEMGYGVDFMMGTHKWHGAAPNDEQAENALSQLSETLGDY